MYEAIVLVGLGAGAALGGCVVGYKVLTATPYVPAAKRTEKDIIKTEEKLNKHFSVINITEEEEHILQDMDPIVQDERPFGEPLENQNDTYEFEASVCESTVKKELPDSQYRTKPNFFLCAEKGCSYRAKSNPAKNGKHYCKNHGPGN